MKQLAFFTTVIIMFLLIPRVYSQGKFSFQFGLSVPLSDFASDNTDNEKAMGAATGFSSGFQYVYKLPSSGIGVFTGMDLNYNWLKHNYRYPIKEAFKQFSNDIDMKYFRYLNIPLEAGLSYITNYPDSKVEIFGKAAFVYNLFKVTNMKIEFDGYTIIQEIDLGKVPGLKIGGGILINDKTTISLDYLRSDDFEIEGQIKLSGYKEDFVYKGKIDLMTLTWGFMF